MLPPEAIRAADELRTLRRDEALPRLGLVDLGEGSRLTFQLAVGVVLSDLARFTAWERAGRRVEPRRWQRLSADLVRLHWIAVGGASVPA